MTWKRRFSSPADQMALPALRREVQAYLEEQVVPERVVSNTGLLISELAHNAVDAAHGGREVTVEVESLSDGGVGLAVECDANRDLDGLLRALENSGTLPSPDSERGRGLWLVMFYSKSIKVNRSPEGWVRVILTVEDEES